MKYTIETTDNGCVETLEISSECKLTKRSTKTFFGCESLDDDFDDQLEKMGFDDDFIEKVYDTFGNFRTLDFLIISEIMEEREENG